MGRALSPLQVPNYGWFYSYEPAFYFHLLFTGDESQMSDVENPEKWMNSLWISHRDFARNNRRPWKGLAFRSSHPEVSEQDRDHVFVVFRPRQGDQRVNQIICKELLQDIVPFNLTRNDWEKILANRLTRVQDEVEGEGAAIPLNPEREETH
jgi:hypothetical protein